MNNAIIGKVRRGSFHFPIQFQLFGEEQIIADAVFDTGCSHSLISAKSLIAKDKTLEQLKKDALFDANVTLSIGKGIESKEIDTTELKKQIKLINNIKKFILENNIDANQSKELITQYINQRY